MNKFYSQKYIRPYQENLMWRFNAVFQLAGYQVHDW